MTPAISALLTTHNRAHFLPGVLEGLENQTLPQNLYEVVVIDDGSADETPALLAGYAGKLPMRVFRQSASGLAVAKNLGIFAATSPILVFLDDDDVLEPGALAAHLAAHKAYPDLSTAVLGHTSLAPDVARSPLMRHVTEVGGQLFSYKWVRPGERLDYRGFWGGRSSCKREFLLKWGVFNPAFRFGYEDIELGWRLRPYGLNVIYEPSASARMIRTIRFEDFCRRSYVQGRAQFRFSQIHADELVREYCEIDKSIFEWTRHWRDYASILRSTRELDEQACALADADREIPAKLQDQLDKAYYQAFALTRAKGVADAIALAETEPPPPAHRRYGLPGNFDELLARLKTRQPSGFSA
jgi:glycosyltransferase involved in cell wall biosynthesis